jgi:hypothetical protein
MGLTVARGRRRRPLAWRRGPASLKFVVSRLGFLVLRNRPLKRLVEHRYFRRCRVWLEGGQTLQESHSAVPEKTGLNPTTAWLHWFARTVLPLFVWMVLAPAAVRAGCSHQVSSRNDHAQLPSFLQGAAAALEPAGDASSSPVSPPRFPGSCRGARCDERSNAPIPPAGKAGFRGELWTWCVATTHADTSPRRGILTTATDLHPSRSLAFIFRPPRMLSRS